MSKKFLLVLAILSVACISQAQQLAYEGFDYPLGSSIIGANGGIGWSDAWTLGDPARTITSGTEEMGAALTWPDYASSGNAFRLNPVATSNGNTYYVYRNLGTMIGADGTYWVSVLVNAASIGGGHLFFSTADNSACTVGKKWWIEAFSIDNTEANLNGTTWETGSTYRLVWKYVITSGKVNTFLWVNPDTNIEPDEADADGIRTGDTFKSGTKFTIAGYPGNGTPDYMIDELVFATTYEEVAPRSTLIPDMFEYTTEELVAPAFTTTGTITADTTVFAEGTTSLKAVLGASGNVTKLSELKNDFSALNANQYLAFQFKGDASNAAGDLTLKLVDPNGVVLPTPVATFSGVMNNGNWQELSVRIPADDASWNGVTGLVFTTTSAGTIYLDQLQLNDPAYLVLHWAFDEGTGSTVADLSGNGNDGTIGSLDPAAPITVTDAMWVEGPSGQPGDYAFDFSVANDPNLAIVTEMIAQNPISAVDVLSGEGSFTMMTLINYNGIGLEAVDTDGFFISGFGDVTPDVDTGFDERLLIGWGVLPITSEGTNSVSADWNSPYTVKDSSKWCLYTVTYNADIDKLTIYMDLDQNFTRTRTLIDVSADRFQVGGSATIWDYVMPNIPGAVGDVRVYDKALTRNEIIAISEAEGWKLWYCETAPALDLDGDCKVSLSDFAMFADGWLECGRFPANCE